MRRCLRVGKESSGVGNSIRAGLGAVQRTRAHQYE